MAEDNIKYSLVESIVEAMFSKKPLIIVEGYDDILFYKNVKSKEMRIVTSELIKNASSSYYLPGCEGVIQVISDAQEIISRNQEVKKYLLGIIDRDCRKFIIGTDIELECLFKLKYYSYESHFMTESSAKQLIHFLTSVDLDEITENVLKYVLEEIDEITEDLYYASLEALKGRIDIGYDRITSYETKPETLYQNSGGATIISKVKEKKEELDVFADELGVTLNDAKYIIKGKWFLYAFVAQIYSKILKLKDVCKVGTIEQCDYCTNGFYEKCKWKNKVELKRSNYVSTMITLNCTYENEIQYIRDKFCSLG